MVLRVADLVQDAEKLRSCWLMPCQPIVCRRCVRLCVRRRRRIARQRIRYRLSALMLRSIHRHRLRKRCHRLHCNTGGTGHRLCRHLLWLLHSLWLLRLHRTVLCNRLLRLRRDCRRNWRPRPLWSSWRPLWTRLASCNKLLFAPRRDIFCPRRRCR